MIEHRPQVFHVEQQPALIISDPEQNIDDAALGFIQPQQPRQQLRAKLGNGQTQRMPLLAIHIPKHHRRTLGLQSVNTYTQGALLQLFRYHTRFRDAREVTLDIGHQHRDTQLRKGLRQHLQRNGLTGAGRARNQPVTIGHARLNRHAASLIATYQQRGNSHQPLSW